MPVKQLDTPENRGGDQQRAAILGGAKRIRLVRQVHLVVRRRQAYRPRVQDNQANPRHEQRIGRAARRFESARFQIRRLDDLLCVYAGGGFSK